MLSTCRGTKKCERTRERETQREHPPRRQENHASWRGSHTAKHRESEARHRKIHPQDNKPRRQMRKKTQRTTRQEEIARSRLAKPRTAPRNLESSDAEQNRGPGMRRAGHGDGERSRRGRAARGNGFLTLVWEAGRCSGSSLYRTGGGSRSRTHRQIL